MGSAIRSFPLTDPLGLQAPSPAGALGIAMCAPAHREDLEVLLDLVRSTVELECMCDYAERPEHPGRNRAVFMAHFAELEATLDAFDERVERVRAAPAALWERLDSAAQERGIREPPFALGPLIDRMAVVTLARARRGQLRTPHQLSLERFVDRRESGSSVSLSMERQRVASLVCSPGEDPDDLADTAQRALQELFDEAQHSAQAREIDDARDSLLAIKSHLLGLLAQRAATDTIAPAASCPVCGCVPERLAATPQRPATPA
jgi:hypothetical protein